MNFKAIRTTAIQAMFSDDLLMDIFVLKGGNAIDILYNLNTRSSLDVDISMAGDFDDLDDIRCRISRCLVDRYAAIGLSAFDIRMQPKPKSTSDIRRGGYEIVFKLIDINQKFKLTPEQASRQAIPLNPDDKSNQFIIEISKFEYCEESEEHELEHYTIKVYSKPMIVIEKLRALCQQMPGMRKNATPRARDFYDIFSLISISNIDLTSDKNLHLLKAIFGAKAVPVSLLSKVGNYYDFHSNDWAAVISSAKGRIKPFQFYFDFVCEEIKRLESLWVK